jgi:hypothetical protein
MRILLIGGFRMRVGDGSAYWTIADKLQALGHEVRTAEALGYGMTPTPHSLRADDLLWAEGFIAYSDGVASEKMLEHAIMAHGASLPLKEVGVIVAGVPDVWFGQIGISIWHFFESIALGYAFNVNDVPNSYGLLATANYVTADVPLDSFKPSDAFAPNNGSKGIRVNVDCDGLFPSLAAIAAKHIGVANHPAVIEAIVSCIEYANVRKD